jgi:hypothetical protein
MLHNDEPRQVSHLETREVTGPVVLKVKLIERLDNPALQPIKMLGIVKCGKCEPLQTRIPFDQARAPLCDGTQIPEETTEVNLEGTPPKGISAGEIKLNTP